MTQEEIDKEASKYPHERTFKAGVEFAKSKMYSEEEVLELLLKLKIEASNLYYEDMKEWFEKFKKK